MGSGSKRLQQAASSLYDAAKRYAAFPATVTAFEPDAAEVGLTTRGGDDFQIVVPNRLFDLEAGDSVICMQMRDGSYIILQPAALDAGLGFRERARVYNSGNITCTTGVNKLLTFNTEDFDTANMHSTSSNTGRLTAPVAGVYFMHAEGHFGNNAVGYRRLELRLDGATTISTTQIAPSGGAVGTNMAVSTMYSLSAGAYVECWAFQNSGGNLDIVAAATYSPSFMMHRVG